jgi:glycosyltransferase involved in cell wall biosynthesis
VFACRHPVQVRIAYLVNGRSANGLYRTLWPMGVLGRTHDVFRIEPSGDVVARYAHRMRETDVLCVHRYTDAAVVRLMAEVKAHGGIVTWDEDDDAGALPRNTNAHRRFGGVAWERRLREMRRLFQHVDVATAPSARLAQRLLQFGARETRAIENYVPSYYLARPAERDGGITIGWVAALEHQMEAQRLSIAEHLQRLLDERPEVHVVSIGFGLGLRSERYRSIDFVPTYKLIEETAAFDIGIAPLLDIPFNHARSNVKVKEYASTGTAWLASPVGPYAGFGEQQGGRLVSDDRWYEELVRLIDRPRERRKLAKRAYRWAESQTIERHAYRWEELFRETLANASRASQERRRRPPRTVAPPTAASSTSAGR